MRRDREDELDPAYVGRETDATAHGVSIAELGWRTKRLSRRFPVAFCIENA
jgi:hypothetical protein